MDPVRNPYAPGAGQRPPELAGRAKQLDAFDVVLERISRGRPERSVMLTGLRGVGKTVLLNQLRSAARSRDWGTGKLEARPDQELRRPLASALHMAVRSIAVAHRNMEMVDDFLGILKAFALRATAGQGHARALAARHRRSGRHRPRRFRRHRDRPGGTADGGRAGGPDIGVGIAIFIDEMQDLAARTSPRSAAPATS